MADPSFPELGDLGEHSYCYRSLQFWPDPDITERAPLAMNTVDYQTIVKTESKEWNCGSHTDVMFQQYYFGAEQYGKTECFKWNAPSYTECDRWAVTIGYSEINRLADHPLNEIRHTLCHEIGHTLGVRHYGTLDAPASPDAPAHSCMRSGIHDAAVWANWSYGPHHINSHINSRWD